MGEIEDLGEFDAIVIGAGMAGLMAGNAMADAGNRVLMLEKHSLPGGCTNNFQRGSINVICSVSSPCWPM